MNLDLKISIPSIVIERTRALWLYFNLSCGIRGIDAQHVWLIALILELEWVQSHEPDSISEKYHEILSEVKKYALEHFKAEEKLLNHFGFTDEIVHKKVHIAFSETLEHISTKYKSKADAEKLQVFLRKWLISHIQIEDKKYSDFFQRRKLVATANEYFNSNKDPFFKIEKEKLDLLVLVSKKFDDIECTTPSVLKEILSIWKQLNLSIGVPIIDIQHLWLIKMIVDMDEAMNESTLTREAVLSETINEAIQYIDIHFRTEEALMNVIGFPESDSHTAKHHSFERFVSKRQKEFKSGNARSAMTLASDLQKWLTNHIAIEDKALTEHYRNNKEAALQFSKDQINSGKAGLRQNQLNLYKTIVQGKNN